MVIFIQITAIPFFAFSQSTNISGIINTYHSVTAILPTGAGVSVDDATGLAYGNYVLLIQMKGATISTSNNSSFGDTVSLSNTGNHEVAVICSVAGDSIYFFNQLLNNYSVTDKVQLIKFGEYYSANITDTVRAMSWDNASGKGGVLAIRVDEDLSLNAPILADSAGYKGGSFLLHTGTCSNFFQSTGYVYDGNTTNANQSGAYKGEGVASVVATQDGGRGAPANGGGGGNNHNNGGGGGANLFTGGRGGGNFSITGCTGNFRGLAGKALSSWNGSKIFCGGGGGAGHANNNISASGGGNGGGIIFIMAKNIYGNGYKISANGQPGGSNISDGASGGGAGGTIIMHIVNNYSGSLSLEANGGNGGNSDNDLLANRCYGSGGGGSGGVIYFNGSLPGITTSVNGGTAGANIDINGCGAVVAAENGNNGTLVTGYTYRASTNPSAGCPGALPENLLFFNASLTHDKKVIFQWKVTNPGEIKSFIIEKLTAQNSWQLIKTINPYPGQLLYETLDNLPLAGENIYRLQIKTTDNNAVYSSQRKVVFKIRSFYSLFPNPAKNKITITGKLTSGTRVRITDLNGKMLNEKLIDSDITAAEINLPSLPSGIYLVKIKMEILKIIIY